MKRIISIIAAVAVLASCGTAYAARYADVADNSKYSTAIETLSDYGIISGYAGYFNPDGFITRAEAAKITVVTAGLDEEASARAGIKKFNDVELGNWSTGYINVAAENNYILGYPNGYYMPQNNITFAEMTTIVLRLLGYDSSVLGDNWPYSYMVKARELGITEGIDIGETDPITRAESCLLIYNALSENIYGTGQKLSAKVSEVKYYDPIVIKSDDPYYDLAAVGITRDNINEYKIIRDGYSAGADDIELYDVVYKTKNTNTIYIYCDKITGVYKKAYPSKADVTSVEISSSILEIETQTAKDKLGETAGAYKINSKLTALIGKDGKIVDVVDVNENDTSAYCVILSATEEVSEEVSDRGETKRYINVINGNGRELSYETAKDYSETIGAVGKLSFDNEGLATFTVLKDSADVTGTVDKTNNRIGSTWLTGGATIIELVYAPETETGEAIAKEIDIDDITIDTIYSDNVVYALETGEFGDVSFLVLKNVTNNNYTYGILKDSSVASMGMDVAGSYTVIVNGKEMTYSTNFGKSLTKGIPVSMMVYGGQLKSIDSLKNVARAKLNAIDEVRVKVGNTVTETADNVQIYRYSLSKGYTSISVSQAKDYIGDTASVFVDSAISGGIARVIIIYE